MRPCSVFRAAGSGDTMDAYMDSFGKVWGEAKTSYR